MHWWIFYKDSAPPPFGKKSAVGQKILKINHFLQNLDLKFMFSLKFSIECLNILQISPNHVIFNTILH